LLQAQLVKEDCEDSTAAIGPDVRQVLMNSVKERLGEQSDVQLEPGA
jgi:hypothetical protein